MLALAYSNKNEYETLSRNIESEFELPVWGIESLL